MRTITGSSFLQEIEAKDSWRGKAATVAGSGSMLPESLFFQAFQPPGLFRYRVQLAASGSF